MKWEGKIWKSNDRKVEIQNKYFTVSKIELNFLYLFNNYCSIQTADFFFRKKTKVFTQIKFQIFR